MFNVKLSEIYRKMKEMDSFGVILAVFFFLLPFQTRKAFFLPETHIGGSFIFYNAGFVFLTDIILFAAVLILIYQWYKGVFNVKHSQNRPIIFTFTIWTIISGISILNVSHETFLIPLLGFTKLLLIGLFICFMISLSPYLLRSEWRSSVKRLFHSIFWLILATSVIQAIIGVSQYFYQRSLGLKILGEEVIRPYFGGIAKFQLEKTTLWTFDLIFDVSRKTSDIVRPYGTFPHPNVYGAFLFMASIITCYLIYVSRGTKTRAALYIILFLQIFAAAMAFSRVAMVSWAIGLLCLLGYLIVRFTWNKNRDNKGGSTQVSQVSYETQIDIKKVKKIAFALIISGLIVGALFYSQFLERGGVVSYGTTNEKSISERALYAQISWNMIKTNPLSGVGFQNFVQAMDKYSPQELLSHQHQPVHNVYLLIASEIGLLGLAAFLGFIFFTLRSAFKAPFNLVTIALTSIFLMFLFIGFFDHYLLTIQQGRLMFFSVAGLLILSTRN